MPFAHGKTLLIAVLACLALAGRAGAQDMVERGQQILAGMCSQCHAIEQTGASPHAGAPAFRDLDQRLDLDEFTDRLREGLQSSHRDMPSVRFSRDDARAIVAYLRSLER
jgi:mono/diheme cytochrome c family protein